MKRNRIRVNNKVKVIVTVIALLIFAVSFAIDTLMPRKATVENGECEIHFVDVGQGDCTMALTEESVVVVDCGPRDSAESTCDYIKKHTDTIDYLVLTHPHEDHIGGAETLIRGLTVKNVIMNDSTTDTLVFDRLLDALDERNVNVIEAKAGNTYSAGEIEITILSPGGEFTNINDYSVVSRISYKDVSVMVTGDVEHNSEKNMVDSFSRSELGADILKVSHHGSSTSSHKTFVDAVDPQYAVIQCGLDNSYGHPHRETVELLEVRRIEYYRTDECGSIVFVTDGRAVEPKDQ